MSVLSQMLVMILLLFSLSWGAWMSERLITKFYPMSPIYYENLYWFSTVAKYLPVIHATINPVVYW